MLLFYFLSSGFLIGQNGIVFTCDGLNLHKESSLKCDPISEDDPGDLEEAYGYLISYLAGGKIDQRMELRFPTRVADYHWRQSSVDDKNDSLSAELIYNTNPERVGYTMDAFPRDFHIRVTKYENKPGGVVEGVFEGTMEALLAWKQTAVSLHVKGNFHSIRTGKPGDECRKQRRAEKLVIGNSLMILESALTKPLEKMGWEIAEKKLGYNALITNLISPFKPLSLCSDFLNLKLLSDPHSEFGRMLQDSARRYSDQLSQNINNTEAVKFASRNLFRIQNMQQAEIDVSFNYPYLKEDYSLADKDKYSVIVVPGTSYACRIYNAPGNELETPEERTKLFFGNWKGADLNAGIYKGYPFIHRKQGPFIENIVVTIIAPAENADRIIRQINWAVINQALTH